MVLLRALVFFALLISIQGASADGRIYASDYTPEIPDQRALIAFDGERQVMLIENRIALPDGRPTTSLGWVVPVPAVPEITVAESANVGYMYRQLRRHTGPVEPISMGSIVFSVSILGLMMAYGRRQSERPGVKTLGVVAWFGLIGSIFAAISLSAPMQSGPDSGVEVVKALQVGPLDAKVVRASSGAELVDWLKSNGFSYGERDIAVIEGYLRQKWFFVVARLAPQTGSAFEGAAASPPLVLSFPTREAVYPVALTAVGGKPLDLVLYVFAPYRVQSNAMSKVDFAGAVDDEIRRLGDGDKNKAAVALFAGLKGADYLTKLSGKLSPEEMRTDIRLVNANDTGDYRRWTTGPIFNFWIGGAALVALAAYLLQLAARGRWQCDAVVWFMISICISPIAVLLLLGNVVEQWWDRRNNPKPDSRV